MARFFLVSFTENFSLDLPQNTGRRDQELYSETHDTNNKSVMRLKNEEYVPKKFANKPRLDNNDTNDRLAALSQNIYQVRESSPPSNLQVDPKDKSGMNDMKVSPSKDERNQDGEDQKSKKSAVNITLEREILSLDEIKVSLHGK